MVDDSVDHSWKPSLRRQNMLQGHGCLAIGGAMGSPQPSSEMLLALVNHREFQKFQRGSCRKAAEKFQFSAPVSCVPGLSLLYATVSSDSP